MSKLNVRKIAAATVIAGALTGAGAALAPSAFAATGESDGPSAQLIAQCGDREIKGKACHNVIRPSGYNFRSSVQGEVREAAPGQVLGGVNVVPGGFNAPAKTQEPWEWHYDSRAAGGIGRANSAGPGYGG